MENLDLKKFKRENYQCKRKPFTVNLTDSNHLKVKNDDIYLSKAVNYFLENTDREYLLENFSKSFILSENKGRKVTSISVKPENLEKIENINMTLLVNHIIEIF